MVLFLMSVSVPLAVYLVAPITGQKIFNNRFQRTSLLAATCMLYFFSWHLPSPSIHGQNTSFTTHLVGGGIFSGLLWLYGKRQLGWKSAWPRELLSLLALVSLLGVANELLELSLVEFGLLHLPLTDTSWDLLANTLGALLFWLGYRLQNS